MRTRLGASARGGGARGTLTRCLHLDGLADTADGLGSRAPADRALEIMRKSDIGPFGVVTLVIVLVADVAAVSSVAGNTWSPVSVLAVAAATGRVAAVQAAVRGARPQRGRAGSGRWSPTAFRLPAVVAWTIGVLALGDAARPGRRDTGGLGASARRRSRWARGGCCAQHAQRRLGGMTGDVFGALIESVTVDRAGRGGPVVSTW